MIRIDLNKKLSKFQDGPAVVKHQSYMPPPRIRDAPNIYTEYKETKKQLEDIQKPTYPEEIVEVLKENPNISLGQALVKTGKQDVVGLMQLSQYTPDFIMNKLPEDAREFSRLRNSTAMDLLDDPWFMENYGDDIMSSIMEESGVGEAISEGVGQAFEKGKEKLGNLVTGFTNLLSPKPSVDNKQGGGKQGYVDPMKYKPVVGNRIGTRQNPDGSESTHLMSYAQVDDLGGYVAFPTLFQNEQGEFYEPQDPVAEAIKKNEIYRFGNDLESAKEFAAGSWKSRKQGGGKTKYVGETEQGGYTVGVNVDRGDRQRSKSFSLEPSGDVSYSRSVVTPQSSRTKVVDILDGKGTKTITRTRGGETTERTKTLGENRAERLRNNYERKVNRVFTDPFPEVPSSNEGKYLYDLEKLFDFQEGGDVEASKDFLKNWYENRTVFSPNTELTPEVRQALIDKAETAPEPQPIPERGNYLVNHDENFHLHGYHDSETGGIYLAPDAAPETYLHELTHYSEDNPYQQDIDNINYMASLRALRADNPETLDLLSDPRGTMMDERQEADYVTTPTETSARLMTIRERHSDILKPN